MPRSIIWRVWLTAARIRSSSPAAWSFSPVKNIGIADSNALKVANDVFRAVETIGYPECQFNLAHGVVYLATAPKDRAAGKAYFDALEDVKERGNLQIPLHIRNAPTQLMRELGYGDGYRAYTDESMLPAEIKGKRYYRREG